MSVLFKSPSSGVSGMGGSSTGFPPGDVSNINNLAGPSMIKIKWQDPEDTILDEAIFVKWKGTLLIRNKDHYPNSIKDGDIVIDNQVRNKYKDTWYIDDNLDVGVTYYYRFFPYSEDKVYNDSNNMIFKAIPMIYHEKLSDNTWEQIISASESDNIPDTWKIGDTINLTLSGKYNETITLQIWDFNHYDKSDGSGKAGILFGMKNLMKEPQYMAHSDYEINSGGWNNAAMKRYYMINVYESMPPQLKSAIKEVKTEANINNTSTRLSKDKIFIPGYTECGNDRNIDNNDGNQTAFPIFTNNNSRKKRLNNGSGETADWWTRSICHETSSDFWYFDYTGTSFREGAYNKKGVCFCFNI